MNTIAAVIAEMCPNGVEHKPLGVVGDFVRGQGLQKNDLADEGVGCIHYGEIYKIYGTSTATTRSFVAPELAARLRKAKHGDLVVTTTSENIEDVCKAVAWMGDSDIAIGGHACVFSHSLNPLYASFLFQTEAFRRQKKRFARGTKVKEVSTTDLARIVVPVPHPEIQHAISEVLAELEALGTNLSAELRAEMAARHSQHRYYRDHLFAFSEGGDVPWRPMGDEDVGEFIRGRRITKSDFTETGVGAIHYGELYTHYGTVATEARTFVSPELAARLRHASHGDLVIAATGEDPEAVCKATAWLGDDDVVVHDDCYIYRHTLNPKYAAYFMQSESFHRQKRQFVAGAKVSRVSGANLAKIRIPVPSLLEQERIVRVLERYEVVEGDISAALLAERTARRRQFECYRDRLLTFDEAA